MQTVGNYPDLASARVAQSLLEAEGIEAVIPDEYLAGVDWQLGTAIQGVRLQVRDEDAEEARDLLAQPVPAEGEPCPRCGSDAVTPARWKQRIKALTLLVPILAPVIVLLWPLFALVRPSMQCTACGHRWKT